MDKEILNILTKIDINKLDFKDEVAVKDTILKLFNVIEYLVSQNTELKEKNQQLTNEINELKGEKGKPDIKANIKDNNKKNNNIVKMSSLERTKKKRKKSAKNDSIKIDREEVVKIDKTKLPADAEFKGYRTRVVQNIEIKTDNVLYKIECYYSKSEGKTYAAELPEYLNDTEFGAELKAFVYSLYYECRVTEVKIAEILNSHGIQISEGTVSNILIYEKSEAFTAEKKEIFETAIEVSEFHQIDDTGMRVNGVNHYATILCNHLYAAYFIRRYKNRETVMRILSGIGETEEVDITKLIFLIKILIADDAPQFKKIVESLGLCWIHEERHYEKMIPVIQHHKEILAKIISQIWDYYKELKKYKEVPTQEDKILLGNKFDEIFTQTTGYDDLDARLKLTYGKKQSLLLVLEFPQIPLHNNESELGARAIVTKRKISGGVRTNAGKLAWENGLSIYATCRKHAVGFYDYVLGIFKGSSDRLHLSNLIREKNTTSDNTSTDKSDFLEKPA